MNKNIIFIFIGMILSLLYIIPFILLGENSYITIHDTLDHDLIHHLLIAKNKIIFNNNAIIPQIMNGFPRSFLRTGFDIVTYFFIFFTPLKAFIFNCLIIHIIAFIGMYLFLKTHILNKNELYISFLVSICFSYLPFYSLMGFSNAGIPLIFYSFFNILKNKSRIYDYFIIVLFPFYSSLIHSGVFIIIAFLIILVIDSFKNKKINKKFILAIILLCSVYFLVEFNLIKTVILSNNLISNRIEFDPYYSENLSFYDSIKLSFYNFIYGKYHIPTAQLPIILVFLLCIVLKRKKRKKIFLLFSILIFLSLFYGLYKWNIFLFLKKKILFLRIFDINRFYVLTEFIWYILFALILSSFKYKKIIISIFIIQFLYILGIFSEKEMKLEFLPNISIIYNNITNKKNEVITYKKYYSKELFSQIDNYINKNKANYRVLNIGIEPSVAQYNGFYTLGSYQNNYSLSYKHKFRKIMENELNKDKGIKDFFDKWGCRCYYLTAQKNTRTSINFNIDISEKIEKENIQIENLMINIEQLKKMNCKYIFSMFKIKNSYSKKLKFLKLFKNKNSIWRVYLYKLK